MEEGGSSDPDATVRTSDMGTLAITKSRAFPSDTPVVGFSANARVDEPGVATHDNTLGIVDTEAYAG